MLGYRIEVIGSLTATRTGFSVLSRDGSASPQPLPKVYVDQQIGFSPVVMEEFTVNIRIPTGALLAFALIGATAAQAAAPGYTTADVNFRTGPDVEYPSVGVIPEGDDIYVEGCLRDESWCDVRWDGERGWVYSEYLAFDHRGETVLLPDIGPSVLSIPFIAFAAANYWDRHYVGRPWYKERRRWYNYKRRPRAGWRAPPRGARKQGWWRNEYRAPRGMKAPPRRGWKRPARAERRRNVRQNQRDVRGERRENRRDARGERRENRREIRSERREQRQDRRERRRP